MKRAALLLSVLALAGCDVLNPMMGQQKLKPYRPSGFFPDQLSMRAPPPGVVPARGFKPLEVAAGVGADGKPVAKIPIDVTPELLQLGRRKFDVNCAVCHGFTGDGDSLVARNMSQRPPPSLHQRVKAEDGHYYQVVSQGFGVMPPYSNQLTEEERWAVVAYVRALQVSHSRKLADVPADQRGQLEREQREQQK